ncbi:MAG: MotA/TolQ/ExbB proton channel family protein [Phycisphaerales bacterium]
MTIQCGAAAAMVLSVLAQAEGTDAGGTSGSGFPTSVLGYIHQGGLLSYVLITLSMLALGLIIANLITLRIENLMPERVLVALERLMRERQVDAVVTFAREKENDKFITRVLVGGLQRAARSQFGLLELKPALEESAAKELDRLDRPTHALALLAAIGPMLGLLGTVFGMIGAFGAISEQTGAARSAQLAKFMSLALVNTAEGLVLAIPCTIAYSMFRRRTDRLMGLVADAAERLASTLQAAQNAAKAGAPGPAARPVPLAAPPASAPAGSNSAGSIPSAGGVFPGNPLPPASPRPVMPAGPA